MATAPEPTAPHPIDVDSPEAHGGESACFAHLVADGSLDGHSSAFSLTPVAPYRLDLTAWALRRREDNVIDRWDAASGEYRRAMHTDAGVVDVSVRQTGPPERPELEVHLSGPGATTLRSREQVRQLVVRSLGVESDLSAFDALADDDPFLGPLAERFRGIRPPRFHTWTESLTAAVSCQQLSLLVGVRLLNQLAELVASRGPSGDPAFPTAAELAVVPVERLRALGYSNRKGEVITGLAHRIETGELHLDDLDDAPDEVVLARLCELYGIGRWSAEYVMLRGLGRVNVFPGDDVGAQNKLRRLMGIDSPLDHAAVRELLQRWDPYSGLVYFHLLLDAMADAGLVTPNS